MPCAGIAVSFQSRPCQPLALPRSMALTLLHFAHFAPAALVWQEDATVKQFKKELFARWPAYAVSGFSSVSFLAFHLT
jgi:hypothetical protein